MPAPSLAIACPKSDAAWRITPRRQAARPGRFTATCPSCGQGLTLTQEAGAFDLVAPRITGPGPSHRLAPKVPH